jgi:hypothetical protein
MLDPTNLALRAYNSAFLHRPAPSNRRDGTTLSGPKVGYLTISVDGDPVSPPWGLVAICIIEGGDLTDSQAEWVSGELERVVAEKLTGTRIRVFVDCERGRKWEVTVSGVRNPAVVEWFQGETGFSLGGFVASCIRKIRSCDTNTQSE